MKIHMMPGNNIRVTTANPARPVWEATTNDPQCVLVRAASDECDLEGGWYAFDVRLEVVEGAVASPCLYPDYGQGLSEEERIFLPEPDASGAIRGVLRLKFATRALRFDPSVNAVNFRVASHRLRRIGRISAVVRLVIGVYRNAARKLETAPLRAAATFAKDCWQFVRSHGTRAGGDKIYSAYVQSLAPDGNDYERWLAIYDYPAQRNTSVLASRLNALPRQPLISILMPVYNTPDKWLRRCIDSVRAQAYPNWELCVADDASSAPHVCQVLRYYERLDPRIKVTYRERNGHISASSNSALELATGEWLALLDHDDELPPHALLEVAEAVLRNPQWQLVYSDEDKIDEKGRRFDPYFKPDWNYDLLLSHNCISHLGIYRAALVRDVGGFNEGTEGSQDWDLALRCIERLDPDQVGHIPKVLYHWRAIPGSTALAPSEKNYAHLAAMRVIQAHLDRCGAKASVLEIENHPGNYRVMYALPTVQPKVSLIIPTRDRVDLLQQCVSSILAKTDYEPYEILIIDNQSVETATLEYFKVLAADPRVTILSHDFPFNYSAINNAAVRACSGDIIGFVNNDIEAVDAGWMREMVSHACRQGVGAVGAKLYFPDDTIQHAGVILGFNGIGVHAYAGRPRWWFGQMLRANLIQQFSAVTAACMLVSREAFDTVGGFDEQLAVAYNDVDLCLRLVSAGYRNVWTPYAELYHHESASRGSDASPEKRARLEAETALMMARWDTVIARDPSYNPNLAIGGETFSLAFPPR